jgi:hypothetical protein
MFAIFYLATIDEIFKLYFFIIGALNCFSGSALGPSTDLDHRDLS